MPALVLSLAGCEKDDLKQHSKENITNHRESNLNALTLTEQRSKYVSLDKQERLRLWREKFDILINSTKRQEEKNFYKSIKNNLNQKLVSKAISEYEFNDEWASILYDLQTKFNWTESDIFVTFATLYNVEVAMEEEGNNYLRYFYDNNPIATCECRWGGLGCGGSSCDDVKDCPDKPSDEMGCGFLLLQSCTGECE